MVLVAKRNDTGSSLRQESATAVGSTYPTAASKKMNSSRSPAHVLIVVCLIAISLPADSTAFLKLPANGYLAGRLVSTTVDSALARYYLENSLLANAAGSRGPPSSHRDQLLEERIFQVEERFQSGALDWLTLRALSRRTSPDFATLFFIKRTLSDSRNWKFQTAYRKEINMIKSGLQQSDRAAIARNELRRYHLLFVPGLHYRSDPSSGADFSNQRQWFRRFGLHPELVATSEDGTIEENAAIIASVVRAESGANKRLILISTSKAGPETALALGKILRPDETSSVKAWLSVGGLIRGTFLADQVMSWPKSWLVRILFSASGTDPKSLPGLTTTASRARMKEIRLPSHIFLLEFVAAPLSGDVGSDVKGRYIRLRKYGPNDGLTLLADELLPNGVTIIEPGLDHFYRDPEIDLKSLAIANLVSDELQRGAVMADSQ
jgi:hypothetical protein